MKVEMPKPAAVASKPKKKSFWQKLKDAFKSIGKAIKKAFNAVGNFIGNAFKAVGKLIEKAFNVIKSILSIAMDLAMSALCALTGQFKKALEKLTAAGTKLFEMASPIMMGAMKALSAIQTFLGLEPPGRSLSSDEIEMLKSIYGDSIDYSKVVIKEGKAGLISAANPNAPFVVGNTIYVPPGASNAWNASQSVLVHEMTHVWQYQNGGVDYMGGAVAAQFWGPKAPPDSNSSSSSRGYYFEADVAAGKPFEKLNPEQQAELIEQAFFQGVWETPPKKFEIKVNGTTVDCTDYVLRAWDMIKAGQGAP